MLRKTYLTGAMAGVIMALGASVSHAQDKLDVMISGGFSPLYRSVISEFERSTGIIVNTLSGASQGSGQKTIKAQLERGVPVDVVILSNEGLKELEAAGRIDKNSEVNLAAAPLGAAIRQGSPKPDIHTVEGLKRAFLSARLVVMPGSTSGLFVKNEIFPRLAISEQVSYKIVERGTDSTGMLAAGQADLAIGPMSELSHQAGVEIVGPLPPEMQLVQIFAAAITSASTRSENAKRLIDFLSSKSTPAELEKFGMNAL